MAQNLARLGMSSSSKQMPKQIVGGETLLQQDHKDHKAGERKDEVSKGKDSDEKLRKDFESDLLREGKSVPKVVGGQSLLQRLHKDDHKAGERKSEVGKGKHYYDQLRKDYEAKK